jgi:hypothetical protein
MDTAVALVQAYLHVNGYFTVVEFPILEAFRAGPARTITDLDILAFRFPRAQSELIRRQDRQRVVVEGSFVPDPVLGCPPDHPDMIVGEVKEGAARFNDAARDPAVLGVALARFGCCESAHAMDVARALVAQGKTVTPDGHTVRMVAFGAAPEHSSSGRAAVVPMRHVVEFLRRYLHEHWDVLRHAQLKDQTFGLLALLEKWGANKSAPDDALLAGGSPSGAHRPPG